MASTSINKGKAKAIYEPTPSKAASSSSDSSDSDSEDEEITQEYLESLIQKARANAITRKAGLVVDQDLIKLAGEPEERPLPRLDPGQLPQKYFTFGKGKERTMHDPDVQSALQASSSQTLPAPPKPPPELTSSGKPLTKAQRKELKQKTAGKDWFDLPAPNEADLPRLYREVEALRLRNQLDPKRFYRKDAGEGKGIKGLPKHFAIGTIVTTSTPFGTASGDNLTRAERKRTLVDELVDDAEAKRYAKRKFETLQTARGARGKNTLKAKQALRKGKW